MATHTEHRLAHLRLLQLISPSLPVGAFTYSQGLEWAVECDWVSDEASLREWVSALLHTNMTQLEIPLLMRFYKAAGELNTFKYWCHYLIASRETKELREEERNRGRALATLLPELGVPVVAEAVPLLKTCQLSGFAHAAHYWKIPLQQAAEAYLWGWLENIILNGIKIIPLGQTAGQRLIADLTTLVPDCVECGFAITDEDIGASCTAQAIASSLHETQYSRIYRS